MRVLVTANDAYGHLFPLAPTIQALARAGHEVLVACDGSDAVASLAGPRITVRGILPGEVAQDPLPPMADPPSDADLEELFLFYAGVRFPTWARGWFVPLLEEAHRWRPDLVIVEPCEFAGRIVAAALGVPCVEHGHGFTWPASIEQTAAETLRDAYAEVGATPRPLAWRCDLGPEELQADDVPHVERFRYVPYAAPAPSVPQPDGRKPRVLVTLGTFGVSSPDVRKRVAQLLTLAAQAAVGSGAEVIVVTGRRSFEDVSWPEEVHVTDWVDMPAEVARCAAVVHHGGAGISYASLDAGIPAVCLPLGGDEYRNAAALTRVGVCLSLKPEAATEPKLREAITRVLTEPNFAEATRHMREANRALPDIGDLVRQLVAVH
jgi:UDP:flavonoid glycosyltransferase YjiC (YdhE family)